jgi:hypothetical protein
VWAFYPESSQRTLEEIDLLFAADSPWAWAAESNFKRLKAENPALGGARNRNSILEAEKGLEKGFNPDTEHEETVSNY